MSISNRNQLSILDLPDEILRAIFHKLNTIHMFYSLVGVNRRFDRLALDSIYIHCVNFTIERFDIHKFSVDLRMLDKICSKILPRINEKVTKLIIDPFCAKHILEAVHYPQLYSLTFVHYQPDTFLRHLLGMIINVV